jgi:hypothetical protein
MPGGNAKRDGREARCANHQSPVPIRGSERAAGKIPPDRAGTAEKPPPARFGGAFTAFLLRPAAKRALLLGVPAAAFVWGAVSMANANTPF